MGVAQGMRFYFLVSLAVISSWCVGGNVLRAQERGTLSGLVRDSTGRAIAASKVSLVDPFSSDAVSATTDSAGVFRLSGLGARREWVLTVEKVDFRTVRRRVLLDPTTPAERLTVVLHALRQTLDAVSVVASRATPPAQFVYEPKVGASERVSFGTRSALGPNVSSVYDQLRTNLFFDPGGVPGLGADETPVQLNGIGVATRSIPRSAPVALKGQIAEYDVASGGFSGGRLVLEPMRAGDFGRRRGDFAVNRTDGSPLGPLASALGATTLWGSADVGGESRLGSSTGPGVSWGTRLERTGVFPCETRDVSSEAAGAAGVSAAAVRAMAPLATEPYALAALQCRQGSTTAGSMVVRLDPWMSRSERNAFVVSADVEQRLPTRGWPSSALVSDAARREFSVAAQHLLDWSDRWNGVWRLRSGVSQLRSGPTGSPASGGRPVFRARPRMEDSLFDLGGPDVEAGGPLLPAVRDWRNIDVQVEREQFLTRGRTIVGKVVVGGRSSDGRIGAEQSTQFWSSSTGSLLRGDGPRLLQVTLNPIDELSSRATGAMSASFVRDRVRASAGLRGDWQQTRLGQRSPSLTSLDLSPRIGLTWNVSPPQEGYGFMQSTKETRQLGPSGVLRLGAGLFVAEFGGPRSTLLDALQSGRATSCLVARNPVGWPPLTVIDSESAERLCDRGDDGLPQSRDVGAAIDSGFRPPRSLRLTAALLSSWRRVEVQVDAMASWSSLQSGMVDQSVPRTPLAAIDGLGARPYFADPRTLSGIDGGAFGRAPLSRQLVVLSDRRGRSLRGAIQVASKNGATRMPFRLGYALGRTTATEGGWDRDAFISPWLLETADSRADRRHQFQAELARSFGALSVSLWTRVASGTPITPLVSGDVNGDGVGQNDRAFIPDPRSTNPDDEAFWRGVGQMPVRIEQCLARQAGGAARRASCRSSWAMSSALSATLDLRLVFRRLHDGEVSMYVDEPLAWIASRLGAAPPLPTFGESTTDNVLLRTNGISAAQRQFRYAVNPLFGQPSVRLSSVRRGPALTLSVRLPLSPSIQSQQLDRWLLRTGVGNSVPTEELARRLARNVPNLYDQMLADDELDLSSSQKSVVQQWQTELGRALWDIWLSAARELTARHRTAAKSALLERVQEAADLAWEANRLSARRLRDILSPIQETLLPFPAARLIRAEQPVRFRIVYY